MKPDVPAAVRTVLVLGNPNVGKSTLFGALTGTRQKTANFPGVTVEAKVGHARHGGPLVLVDLPGTYSLAARSPDEQVAIDALAGRLSGIRRPDGVLVVVDATSLDRNLYLATQVLEFDAPVVVALTMVDVARSRGIEVDAVRLSDALGVPVVPVNGLHGVGLDVLRTALDTACTPREPLLLPYPAELEGGIETLRGRLASMGLVASRPEALRVLVDACGPVHAAALERGGEAWPGELDALRATAGGGRGPAMFEAQTRYGAIGEWTRAARRVAPRSGTLWSDRIDRVLTHRVWGSLILVVVLGLMFQSIYAWAGPLMDVIDGGVGDLGAWVGARMEDGPLRSLVTDGVIAGVGGVLVFLPQIAILFAFIAILEDVGYMARAAFLMDRLMSQFGLSGRAFIPMLSSFACAVPGIMGARVIGDRDTRLTTIFLAPFMSCSARLPVYTLMIGMFVPQTTVLGFLEVQGLVLFAMYSVGVLAAIPTAIILKRGILRSPSTPFLLELPSYKRPLVRNVCRVLSERCGSFLTRAGTIILATAIVVWALGYFPRDPAIQADFEAQRSETSARVLRDLASGADEPSAREAEVAELEALDAAEAGALSRASYLGRMGRVIEPAVRPLGWDWRIGMAVIASFPAREVVIATLGTIFNVGGDADESSQPLQQTLREAKREDGTPLFSLATGLSVMVFFALCMQCAATLAVMRRETNSWRWPIASFTYMTGLAYVCAWATYDLACRLGAGA